MRYYREFIVEGQRLIQATSDLPLGWAQRREPGGEGIDFYYRQLWDGKIEVVRDLCAGPRATQDADQRLFTPSGDYTDSAPTRALRGSTEIAMCSATL